MADYIYFPESKELREEHPLDVAFHKEFFNAIHVCTCQHEEDKSKPVRYSKMVPHPEYKIFAEFIELAPDEIPPHLRTIMMIHNI